MPAQHRKRGHANGVSFAFRGRYIGADGGKLSGVAAPPGDLDDVHIVGELDVTHPVDFFTAVSAFSDATCGSMDILQYNAWIIADDLFEELAWKKTEHIVMRHF